MSDPDNVHLLSDQHERRRGQHRPRGDQQGDAPAMERPDQEASVARSEPAFGPKGGQPQHTPSRLSLGGMTNLRAVYRLWHYSPGALP